VTTAANCVLVINGLTYTQSAGNVIFSNQTGFNLTIQNSHITTSNSVPITNLTGANTVLVADHNIYTIGAGGNSYVYYLSHATSTSVTSDYNNFNVANSWFNIGGVDYGTVAAYQAATSQDANSTVG
jgi:hypothetical protein